MASSRNFFLRWVRLTKIKDALTRFPLRFEWRFHRSLCCKWSKTMNKQLFERMNFDQVIPSTLSWPNIDSFDTRKQIKRSFKWNDVIWCAGNRAVFRKEIYLPSRELKISAFDDNLTAATRDNERRDIDECLEIVVSQWKLFFDEKWRLTESGRKLDLAGNWATYCTTSQANENNLVSVAWLYDMGWQKTWARLQSDN